jgi:hypothetical protein
MYIMAGAQAVKFFTTPREMCEDVDFRSLLVNWDTIGRMLSMGVERLLARYKQANSLDAPTVERFSSAGLLSEWGHMHTDAGGRDCKVVQAADLIADHGIPLKMAKKGDSNDNKRRGNILYVTETWKQEKLQNPDLKLLDYYECQARCTRGFKHLPEAQRQDLNLRAKVSNESALPLPARIPYNVDGELLFGLSSLELPINPDLASELLKEIMGVSEVGGLSSYADRLKRYFVDKIFQADEGKVPKEWKNNIMDHEQCFVKHPGLCTFYNRDIMVPALALTKLLRRFVKKDGGDCILLLLLLLKSYS